MGTKRRVLLQVACGAFTVAMLAGVAMIGWASLPYFFGDELHEFIVEKLPLPHQGLWLAALHVHVASALFSLPACLALLSRRLLQRWPRAHRILGRVTGVAVLFALVPSGSWLALYAKGGLGSSLGFLLSGAIVAVAMVRGITQARSRKFAAHRRSVLHVVAQLSVAVTSRAMLVAFDRFGFDPDQAYLLALWLPVLGSALIASLVVIEPRGNHASDPARLALHPAL
jgi:hypothetical protein